MFELNKPLIFLDLINKYLDDYVSTLLIAKIIIKINFMYSLNTKYKILKKVKGVNFYPNQF